MHGSSSRPANVAGSWGRLWLRCVGAYAGIVRYGETGIRTRDTTIFSRVLYQLSYLAAGQPSDARCYLLSDRPDEPCVRAACWPGAPRRSVFPGFQIRQRVDRASTGGLPAADPHLEVQMRRRRIAGLPGLA